MPEVMDFNQFMEARSKPVAPPATPSSPVQAAAAIGIRLPFVAGKELKLADLTEGDKDFLNALGWKPGQCIPNRESLKQLVQEHSLSTFATLSPERQQEIRDAMSQLIEAETNYRSNEPDQIPMAGPGINAAIAAAADTTPITGNSPEPKPAASLPPIGELSPAGSAGVTHCKKCGHDMAVTDVLSITDEDKRAFLVLVLGGAGVRFYKNFTYYGGAIEIQFRTLTPQESDQILSHAYNRARDGKANLFKEQNELRFYLSIDRVRREGLEMVAPMTTEWTEETLKVYKEWVDQNLLPSESIRRVAFLAFAEFSHRVEIMEWRADDKDFWQGIAAQA